ncbi:hypothetical protein TNCV_2519561 [Trichonephila clavipes]|nr:hypothetical protein TNCV_2519561 [Trichonephila clavipes]
MVTTKRCGVASSSPDVTEDPLCRKVRIERMKSVVVQCPPFDVVWKFGEEIAAQEVSLVTAPVQVQSISPLSSSGRVARFLGGSNRGCAGSEIARVGVESTKKPTPDVVVVFET